MQVKKKWLQSQRKRSGRSAILCVFTHNNGREAQKNQSHRRVALGRRNYLESDINCAIREFTEETGLTSNEFDIIKNIIPFEEIFMGSNFKSYKHKYYLAYIKDINYINLEYQKSEVSDIGWFDASECKNKIRPYNFERLAMFDKICKVINTYNLI